MTLTRLICAPMATAGIAVALAWSATTYAQDPKPLETADSGWIREDIEAGYAEAVATGKPLLVAFR